MTPAVVTPGKRGTATRIWSALRNGPCRGVDAAMAGGCDESTALFHLRRWREAGAVIQGADRRWMLVSDRVRPPGRSRASELESAQQRLWTALRIIRSASLGDLLHVLAQCDGPVPSLDVARSWLSTLALAGYVQPEEGRASSRAARRYTLIRDTGPLAPAIRRQVTTVVRDRNTGADIVRIEHAGLMRVLDGAGDANA